MLKSSVKLIHTSSSLSREIGERLIASVLIIAVKFSQLKLLDFMLRLGLRKEISTFPSYPAVY